MYEQTLIKRYIAAIGGVISAAVAAVSVAAEHPLNGTWYNSYCSQVELQVDPLDGNFAIGEINGIYTSHTGSTGSSLVKGLVNYKPEPGLPTNPKGIPFSLGIQWRLINTTDLPDGTWHWVSTFSGQYHPAQNVSAGSQDTYQIEETLEILNGLVATSTQKGLAETAPVMWPQTLRFKRQPPDYCRLAPPPPPVPYTPRAPDYVSGTWHNQLGEQLTLNADRITGSIRGSLTSGGKVYDIAGLFDTVAAAETPGSELAQQGVTLSLYSKDDGSAMTMAGGVDLPAARQMTLWRGELQSTQWTSRFTQHTLDKVLWIRQ